MEMQAQSWLAMAKKKLPPETSNPQWRFTQIYEALLHNEDLIEPELVELGRLVAKRLAACQQRRRAATSRTMSVPASNPSGWQL